MVDMSETAAKIFEQNLNQLVLVKLRGERAVRGKLFSFDEHMNLVLENAEEISNNEKKKLGTIIVRGDNVVLVSPPPKRQSST
jgi:small nuclear ribonucleoprotein